MQASKKEQRNICLERRRALTENERERFSRLICEKLEDLDAYRNAKCVFSYKASFDEVNPDFLKAENKVFCFPVSYAGGIMDWANLRTLAIGQGHIDFVKFFDFTKKIEYKGNYTLESTAFDQEANMDFDMLNREIEFVRNKLKG